MTEHEPNRIYDSLHTDVARIARFGGIGVSALAVLSLGVESIGLLAEQIHNQPQGDTLKSMAVVAAFGVYGVAQAKWGAPFVDHMLTRRHFNG